MPSYEHPKWHYQFVENLCVICRQKFNFIHHAFVDAEKICKLIILDTLGMPGYTQPKW